MAKKKKKRNVKYDSQKRHTLIRKKIKISEGKTNRTYRAKTLKTGAIIYYSLCMSFGVIIFCFFAYTYYIQGYIPKKDRSNFEIFEDLIVTISGGGMTIYCAYIFEQVRNIKIVSKKKYSNQLRKLDRNLYWGFVITFASIILPPVISLFIPSQKQPIFTFFNAFFFLGLLGFIMILAAFNKPKLVLNKYFLIVGDYVTSMSILMLLALPIVIWQPSLLKSISLFTVYMLLGFAIKYFKQNEDFSFLNIILHSIDIEKLLKAISQQNNNYNARKKALVEIEKRKKKGEIEYLESMHKELAQEFAPKNGIFQKFTKWIIILFVFIITSVGEGLVQDWLNDDIKSFLCIYIKLYCS